ncbi:MAG TPA: cupin domain-containing protein [Thermoleophilaceae bacterium]
MTSSLPIVNSHDIPARPAEAGDIRFQRRRLGAKAGAQRIGCSLFEVPPGARQMPVHQHGDEEEIFFVLGGSGLAWQDGSACTIGPGDTIVHVAGGKPHTVLAGDEGLELLAFASGSHTHLTWLPRAQVMWAGPRWVPVDVSHPFEAEAAAGALERPEPGERPANVVALDTVERQEFPGAVVRRVGAAGGSKASGLNHAVLDAGAFGAPFHCHTLEEELYVVLDGGGTLRLGDDEHPVREGDVIARPPSTGVAHQLVAGDAGLTFLVYGTREPGDTTYYPELGKVSLRGLGVTLDVGE